MRTTDWWLPDGKGGQMYGDALTLDSDGGLTVVCTDVKS